VEAFPDQGTTVRLLIPQHVSIPEDSDVFADWPLGSDLLGEIAASEEEPKSRRINESIHCADETNLVDLVEVDHKSYESQEIHAEAVR
jgi:hypothetical protein